ncbi:ferredoxin--NADP reductase [uncultured Mucilaginibacter sp.]|uniref:ferredoxin--NADP reductase n=1 Tax=uncultured Mucilaginibacter sp. TaxID=797541 RepID=UPI0025CBABD2|nr:ferredoxin--NADP reductase [uncultured Mucilaginibacter sp.]
MLQLKVEAIKWELPDVATLFFCEISGRKVNYKAGQFITLVFDHHDDEIRRSYSLSSSPDEDQISITVKRITNGEISRYLLTKIKPGDIINAVEPAGRFTIEDLEAEKDIFLFAAGSGIVPIFSQLKYALARQGECKFILIYGNQNESSILFKDELNELAEKNPARLKIIHLLSSKASRLNNLVLEQIVRQNLRSTIANAAIYTCGPYDYMRMIRLTLLYMGFAPAQIRKENFVLDTVPVGAVTLNYPPRRIRIHFNKESYDLIVGENQSILQAALQNSIPLPYSCRVGDCSTCSAICKNGRVEMVKNNVLTDADLAKGWILTCTGHPVPDVEIEF